MYGASSGTATRLRGRKATGTLPKYQAPTIQVAPTATNGMRKMPNTLKVNGWSRRDTGLRGPQNATRAATLRKLSWNPASVNADGDRSRMTKALAAKAFEVSRRRSEIMATQQKVSISPARSDDTDPHIATNAHTPHSESRVCSFHHPQHLKGQSKNIHRAVTTPTCMPLRANIWPTPPSASAALLRKSTPRESPVRSVRRKPLVCPPRPERSMKAVANLSPVTGARSVWRILNNESGYRAPLRIAPAGNTIRSPGFDRIAGRCIQTSWFRHCAGCSSLTMALSPYSEVFMAAITARRVAALSTPALHSSKAAFVPEGVSGWQTATLRPVKAERSSRPAVRMGVCLNEADGVEVFHTAST